MVAAFLKLTTVGRFDCIVLAVAYVDFTDDQ